MEYRWFRIWIFFSFVYTHSEQTQVLASEIYGVANCPLSGDLNAVLTKCLQCRVTSPVEYLLNFSGTFCFQETFTVLAVPKLAGLKLDWAYIDIFLTGLTSMED